MFYSNRHHLKLGPGTRDPGTRDPELWDPKTQKRGT